MYSANWRSETYRPAASTIFSIPAYAQSRRLGGHRCPREGRVRCLTGYSQDPQRQPETSTATYVMETKCTTEV